MCNSRHLYLERMRLKRWPWQERIPSVHNKTAWFGLTAIANGRKSYSRPCILYGEALAQLQVGFFLTFVNRSANQHDLCNNNNLPRYLFAISIVKRYQHTLEESETRESHQWWQRLLYLLRVFHLDDLYYFVQSNISNRKSKWWPTDKLHNTKCFIMQGHLQNHLALLWNYWLGI